MREQRFYNAVAAEIAGGIRHDGVWARALAESDGDSDRTKARYIKLRVEQLVEREHEEVQRTETARQADRRRVDDELRKKQRQERLEFWEKWKVLIVSLVIMGIAFVCIQALKGSTP